MRALGAGLAAHLASGDTTLARCWKLVRTDGVTLGFTGHDRVLAFDGVSFDPVGGADGADMPSRLGGQVDTGEILGVLTAEAITESDIALGRYDRAVVETWRVNWAEVSQRVLLRRDTIGEIVREDGMFRAELRSAAQALNVRSGRIYHGLCDARVGDGRCGVALDDPAFSGDAEVAAVRDGFLVEIAGVGGFEAGWFGFGQVTWTSGQRAGLTDQVLAHRREGAIDVFQFDRRVGEWLVPGDGLTVTVGCDRRLATCSGKFGNTLNFRGFPHIPGSDYVLRHPRSGDVRDGRPVVR